MITSRDLVRDAQYFPVLLGVWRYCKNSGFCVGKLPARNRRIRPGLETNIIIRISYIIFQQLYNSIPLQPTTNDLQPPDIFDMFDGQETYRSSCDPSYKKDLNEFLIQVVTTSELKQDYANCAQNLLNAQVSLLALGNLMPHGIERSKIKLDISQADVYSDFYFRLEGKTPLKLKIHNAPEEHALRLHQCWITYTN
ncbi:Hypothetical_protein [Hexamita inflata]|uniref:Hypothetical_protein n=1 Tax=Hexamita inflata TaxID=28002 RepID=A0AA86NS06_9EUKA|nr:Hypothetical protein HINF_LOCUS12184 [Hexamita inflata]